MRIDRVAQLVSLPLVASVCMGAALNAVGYGAVPGGDPNYYESLCMCLPPALCLWVFAFTEKVRPPRFQARLLAVFFAVSACIPTAQIAVYAVKFWTSDRGRHIYIQGLDYVTLIVAGVALGMVALHLSLLFAARRERRG